MLQIYNIVISNNTFYSIYLSVCLLGPDMLMHY